MGGWCFDFTGRAIDFVYDDNEGRKKRVKGLEKIKVSGLALIFLPFFALRRRLLMEGNVYEEERVD